MSTFTGWFGIPGGPEHKSTKVHVVVDGKPACGAKVGPRQEFQFCGHGAIVDYVECSRCKKIALKMLAKGLSNELQEGH